METEFAFIVTSKVTNTTHRSLLLECIRHIRIFYPEHTIYLINDNSERSLFPLSELLDYNIEISDAIVKNGGEINPYMFILDSVCKHDKLIYIHDSVFIKKPLDYLQTNSGDFIPIWYSTKYIWNDIFIPENMEILKNMTFTYNSNNIKLYNLLQTFKNSKNHFVVTFGAMACFNKRFVEFIRDNTNLFSIVNMFKNRNNRCLFERIISSIYIIMYKQMYNRSICGDIIYHPLSFKNSEIYPDKYDNYFVKVWQGR
jgi:hypothetical protein